MSLQLYLLFWCRGIQISPRSFPRWMTTVHPSQRTPTFPLTLSPRVTIFLVRKIIFRGLVWFNLERTVWLVSQHFRQRWTWLYENAGLIDVLLTNSCKAFILQKPVSAMENVSNLLKLFLSLSVFGCFRNSPTRVSEWGWWDKWSPPQPQHGHRWVTSKYTQFKPVLF